MENEGKWLMFLTMILLKHDEFRTISIQLLFTLRVPADADLKAFICCSDGRDE